MYMQVGMQQTWYFMYFKGSQSRGREKREQLYIHVGWQFSYLLEGSRPWTVPCVASQQTDLQTEQKHP